MPQAHPKPPHTFRSIRPLRWIAFLTCLSSVAIALTVLRDRSGNKQETTERSDAIAHLRKYGARIVFDRNDPAKIQSVTFTFNQVTQSALARLTEVGPIESLDFDAAAGIDDESLAVVCRVTSLRELNLGGTSVSDAGVSQLARLKNLRKLYLWRTKVTDRGIAALTGLAQLNTLNLWDTLCSDQTLKSLSEIRSLRNVYVGSAPETDTVFAPSHWSIPESTISKAGVQHLRKQRPEIDVVFWNKENLAPEAPEQAARKVANVEIRTIRSREFGLPVERPSKADWPTFLGEQGDGKSSETGLDTNWRDQPPPLVWQRRVGEGLSAPSVLGSRLIYTERIDEQERVLCLEATTGEEIWRAEFDSVYADPLGYSDGPRCSPVIDDDRVYIVSADGRLCCLHLVSGNLIWMRDTTAEFEVAPNLYGVGNTPVIHGDRLWMIVGGGSTDSPAGIVAFDKHTGETEITTTNYNASYASLRILTTPSRDVGIAFMREGLVSFDLSSGSEMGFLPWAARVSGCVNAATPVIWQNRVFISEAYGPGSAVAHVHEDHIEVIWRDPEKKRERAMRSHWATPIFHQGYLYGCSGRHSPQGSLRCIDADTGRIMWDEPERCLSSLCFVDGHLISLSEDGFLAMIEATPDAYTPVARFAPKTDGTPGSKGDELLLNYPAWVAPVVARRLLFVRGKDRLAALRIISQPND